MQQSVPFRQTAPSGQHPAAQSRSAGQAGGDGKVGGSDGGGWRWLSMTAEPVKPRPGNNLGRGIV
jgi:hypothetical protein